MVLLLRRTASEESLSSPSSWAVNLLYNVRMSNHVIHISKAEAASNFASLLDRVRAGAEVIIEDGSRAVAVLRSAPLRPGRLLSESIALAEAHAIELGYTPTLDRDFAADLQEIINSHREPLNPPAWN